MKSPTVAARELGPIETSRWVRDRTYRVAKEVEFRGVPAGRDQLRFALTDPRAGKPIALPIAGRTGDGHQRIGGIRLSAAP